MFPSIFLQNEMWVSVNPKQHPSAQEGIFVPNMLAAFAYAVGLTMAVAFILLLRISSFVDPLNKNLKARSGQHLSWFWMQKLGQHLQVYMSITYYYIKWINMHKVSHEYCFVSNWFAWQVKIRWGLWSSLKQIQSWPVLCVWNLEFLLDFRVFGISIFFCMWPFFLGMSQLVSVS